MISEALKQIRLFHQKKQSELARELSISNSYLSEIESGKKTATLELLKKYSDVFSIPVSSLILFSENIDHTKKAERLRISCANKIIAMMRWVNERDEAEEQKNKT